MRGAWPVTSNQPYQRNVTSRWRPTSNNFYAKVTARRARRVAENKTGHSGNSRMGRIRVTRYLLSCNGTQRVKTERPLVQRDSKVMIWQERRMAASATARKTKRNNKPSRNIHIYSSNPPRANFILREWRDRPGAYPGSKIGPRNDQ